MSARPWLILSLALNVALAGAIVWAALTRHGGSAPFSVAQQLTNRTLRIRKVVTESAPVTVEVAAPFHWGEVESTDYRVYMANLRTIGCPERTIRDIIVADLDQLYAARLHELFVPLHRQLWHLLAKFDDLKDEGERYEEGVEAMQEERAAVLKELLGHEKPFQADDEEERVATQQAQENRLLDFLSPEKREQVSGLRKNFEEARKQLWKSDHQLTQSERTERQQQQRELEANRDRQLAELLTAEELAEYRLRNSPYARNLLRESRVEFSEDELRKIVGATTAEQEAARQFPNTPEGKRQREELARRTSEELKAALGEVRFAEYERASDGRFEQLSQVIERYRLPDEKAAAAYDVLRQAEAQARQLRADASRPVEARTALLQAIRAETERTLAAELGARALTTYRDRGGDGWLNQLSAPPKP
jgi:hypothetical protein